MQVPPHLDQQDEPMEEWHDTDSGTVVLCSSDEDDLDQAEAGKVMKP